MTMIIDRRSADIALVDQIWRGRSESSGTFISGAAIHWELAVTCGREGALSVTLRGPETQATSLTYSGSGEWWGIRFRLGSHVLGDTAGTRINQSIALPVTGDRSFTLNDVDIPIRGYEHAEATVHRMVQAGVIVSDPVVEAAWLGALLPMSQRSLQRRFRQVTGLNQRTARQIARATEALSLLRQGRSILDTVDELGFCDQAHLTRSLHRWTGHTPSQVGRDR